MAATIVIGAQWGDEGKGKIIDYLAEKSDYIVRFHGGNNAGHTIINSRGKFALHLVPAGIFNEKAITLITNGVVVDLEVLLSEIKELEKKGLRVKERLFISPRAHLIMPYHKLLDNLYEEAKGNAKTGTTGRGIGPAYADKVSYNGIRLGDLINFKNFSQKLKVQLLVKNKIIKALGGETLNQSEIEKQFFKYRKWVTPLVTETSQIINLAIDKNKSVLFEGAQGVFLDNDWGTYPFVTASSMMSGGVTQYAGVAPQKINDVLGIAKAYTTRVGEGPFPTELKNEIGNKLREEGLEFGATTGRPRRCGWLDLELLRFAGAANGFCAFALTKLDVLDSLQEIKVATHYEYNGEKISYQNLETNQLNKIKPIYKTLKGWKTSTKGITKFNKLPRLAQYYIKFIENELKVPIKYVSTGSERNETIKL